MRHYYKKITENLIWKFRTKDERENPLSSAVTKKMGFEKNLDLSEVSTFKTGYTITLNNDIGGYATCGFFGLSNFMQSFNGQIAVLQYWQKTQPYVKRGHWQFNHNQLKLILPGQDLEWNCEGYRFGRKEKKTWHITARDLGRIINILKMMWFGTWYDLEIILNGFSMYGIWNITWIRNTAVKDLEEN